MKNMPEKLRKAMAAKEYLATPGLATPMDAMVLEKAGFDFVYMSGYATSLQMFGWPDVGLLTETEMVENARRIARVVNIPVIADADTGFGNAINVIRTVEDYEAAGTAGIHIEDQVSPKRCGHMAGKTLIPLEEAVGKVKAALSAKQNRDFVVIARTDAVAAVGGGIEEAIRRGKAYAQAGADMVFCEFPTSDVEMPRTFAAEVRKAYPNVPLFFNYSSSLDWTESKLTFSDLAAMGYKVIIVSMACLRVGLQSVWDYAQDMIKRQDQTGKDFERTLKKHPTYSFHQFAGLAKIREKEASFLPAEEVRKKYEGSIGS
ncbi:MAG: isocitrate lyase/PEP mutase family protein [Syntrophales bacterium]